MSVFAGTNKQYVFIEWLRELKCERANVLSCIKGSNKKIEGLGNPKCFHGMAPKLERDNLYEIAKNT